MKNLIFLFLTIATININAQSETRELQNFDSFSVNAGIKVNAIPSNTNYAEVEVSGTELNDVITKVSRNNLEIEWRKNNWNNTKRNATVTLYYIQLNGINASSGAIINAKNMVTDDMDIESSSGAKINLEIDCKDIDLDISSGTIINLTGTAESMEVDASSGAICKALELKANDAEIDGSSGAIVKVDVCESLEAEVSSGAIVKYKGNPKKTDLAVGEWSGGVIKKVD